MGKGWDRTCLGRRRLGETAVGAWLAEGVHPGLWALEDLPSFVVCDGARPWALQPLVWMRRLGHVGSPIMGVSETLKWIKY